MTPLPIEARLDQPKKLRVLDLFSGIGGFSLGLERTGGFETVAFCEIEPYPRAVLKKHWPKVPCYEDVRILAADALARDGIAVDVICAGFPCQDLSGAGKQAGMEGTRSGLWSEIARLAGELRPRFIIVENVAALLSGPSEQPGGWFGRVLGDLAALGYDAEWHCIPASAVGAPHRRDRVWVVANDREVRRDARWAEQSLQGARLVGEAFADQPMADTTSQRRGKARQLRSGQPAQRIGSSRTEMADAMCSGLADGRQAGIEAGAHAYQWGMALTQSQRCGRAWWAFEPGMDRVADGVPNRTHRIAALGNAVVPAIPELIGRAILQAEGMTP